MELKHTLFEKEGNVAVITVNRPDKRNALNKDVRLELRAILEEVKADPRIKVLVVTGVGDKAFIAGSDIGQLKEMNPLDYAQYSATLGQQLYTDFENLDIPVIAMINGFALGAGLELALACDIRIAAEGAKLGLPEILLGIIPGGGGTQRLSRLVGAGRAKEMIYTGDLIAAAEAERIGLVNRVVPASELRSTVMALAQKIASRSKVAMKLAKKAINKGAGCTLEQGLDYESALQCLAFTSEDHTEGLGAFLEKRPPQFKDR